MATKNQYSLPKDVQEATQNVFLAGIGALSVAEEEGGKLFKKLVKKGKKYDGAARKEVEQMRKQVEGQFGQVRKDVDQQADKVKKTIDTQVGRVREAADTQVGKARKVADDTLNTFEQRVQEAVTVALQGLGIPTRDEIASLRKSVQQLSKNLDALKHERKIEAEAQPEITAVETANGWYDLRVHGKVVGKVHGEEEAIEEVVRLQRENETLTAAERASGIEAVKTGGGWYQIKLNGLVVDKVQGQEAAEMEVARLEAQA